MAATVSWEGLRELAGFRAEKGRAISFYLNLDPRVSPTAGDVATRVNSLLDEAGKRAIAARTDLTHDQRVSLKADLDRIRSYYEMEFSRDGAHGLAVFSDGLDNFWRPLPLTRRDCCAASCQSTADGLSPWKWPTRSRHWLR